MINPDIELSRLITDPSPNLGFYSAVEIFISGSSIELNAESVDWEKMAREVVLEEQDELTEIMGRDPGESGVLIDAIEANRELLREIQ